jgi:hypothetical protein
MSKNRHYCAPGTECNCIPTDRDLFLVGLEEWQVKLVRKLPVGLQWEVHDEYIRRLMSGDEANGFRI